MAAKRSAARAKTEPAEVRPAPAPARGLGKAVTRSSLALDRVIHERVRLAVVSALAVNDTLTFADLKRLTGATDGNLSVHARKLEDAGYLTCHKSFQGRLPRTEYRLTAAGRRAIERYLAHMEGLIGAMRGGAR
jgi:DNA-binding HxlR family transcriptional regulator